mgnify:CR=1 FL=1
MTTHLLDAIILGGGAAGLMCALTAGRRGRRVLVIRRDAATGFDCVGGWGAWFCGPLFGGDPLANRRAAAASD